VVRAAEVREAVAELVPDADQNYTTADSMLAAHRRLDAILRSIPDDQRDAQVDLIERVIKLGKPIMDAGVEIEKLRRERQTSSNSYTIDEVGHAVMGGIGKAFTYLHVEPEVMRDADGIKRSTRAMLENYAIEIAYAILTRQVAVNDAPEQVVNATIITPAALPAS
jgi:hypothetical protein